MLLRCPKLSTILGTPVQVRISRCGIRHQPHDRMSPCPPTHQDLLALKLHRLHGLTWLSVELERIQTNLRRISEKMLACAVHFNFNVSNIQRYLGGFHTSAHLDPASIEQHLRNKAPDRVVDEVVCIIRSGAPKHCNAESSQANYQRYKEYGNHKPAYQHEDMRTYS